MFIFDVIGLVFLVLNKIYPTSHAVSGPDYSRHPSRITPFQELQMAFNEMVKQVEALKKDVGTLKSSDNCYVQQLVLDVRYVEGKLERLWE